MSSKRWTGLRIPQQTEMSRATVSRILRQSEAERMRDLAIWSLSCRFSVVSMPGLPICFIWTLRSWAAAPDLRIW